MERLRIRKANTADAGALALAEQEIARRPDHHMSLPVELDRESLTRKIQRLESHPRGLAIAAELSGYLVGHAFLEPFELERLSHIVRLVLVVHPGFQGKGVGTRLLQHAIDWAKNTHDIEKIELVVRSENEKLLRLYREFGFEVEGWLKPRANPRKPHPSKEVCLGLALEP